MPPVAAANPVFREMVRPSSPDLPAPTVEESDGGIPYYLLPAAPLLLALPALSHGSAHETSEDPPITVTPEPATWALLLPALPLLFVLYRRRKSADGQDTLDS